MKRFEYPLFGKELKKQTGVAKKQYQKLDNTCESDKIIKKVKPKLENYSKPNVIYDANHSFYKYYGVKKIDSLSFKSKHSLLKEIFDELHDLNIISP